jgi:hypothetical protein
VNDHRLGIWIKHHDLQEGAHPVWADNQHPAPCCPAAPHVQPRPSRDACRHQRRRACARCRRSPSCFSSKRTATYVTGSPDVAPSRSRPRRRGFSPRGLRIRGALSGGRAIALPGVVGCPRPGRDPRVKGRRSRGPVGREAPLTRGGPGRTRAPPPCRSIIRGSDRGRCASRLVQSPPAPDALERSWRRSA